MFYLEQLPDELLTIENNPNIELKKDTRLTPKDREIKIWLWVAYGMIAVKNVYKHPSYRPRVGCNCINIGRLSFLSLFCYKCIWLCLKNTVI